MVMYPTPPTLGNGWEDYIKRQTLSNWYKEQKDAAPEGATTQADIAGAAAPYMGMDDAVRFSGIAVDNTAIKDAYNIPEDVWTPPESTAPETQQTTEDILAGLDADRQRQTDELNAYLGDERSKIEAEWQAALAKYNEETFPGVRAATRLNAAKDWYDQNMKALDEFEGTTKADIERIVGINTNFYNTRQEFYNVINYVTTHEKGLIDGFTPEFGEDYKSAINDYIEYLRSLGSVETGGTVDTGLQQDFALGGLTAPATTTQYSDIISELQAEIAFIDELKADPQKFLLSEEGAKILAKKEWDEKSNWEKFTSQIGQAFNFGEGGSEGWAQLWERPLALVTAPLVPIDDQLQWWHENVDVPFGSFLWQITNVGEALGEFALTGKMDYDKYRVSLNPWDEEAIAEYRTEAPGWAQLGIEIANPIYWIGLPMAGKAIGEGVKIVSKAPELTRAFPEIMELARGSELARGLELIQQFPKTSRLAIAVSRYPSIENIMLRTSRLIRPMTPYAAAALTPTAQAARLSIMGYGGIAAVNNMILSGVWKGATYPIVAPVSRITGKLAEKVSLRNVTMAAREKGWSISIKPATIEGRQVGLLVEGTDTGGARVSVYARDLMEVGELVETGSLLPTTDTALREAIYIQELGQVVTKSEFKDVLGGRIVKTEQGTVYQLAEHPNLTVVSESSLSARGLKSPQWISDDLAKKATTGFKEYYEEQAKIQLAATRNFELISTEEMMSQRFFEDKFRKLAVSISKLPGGEAAINAINASGAAEGLAKRAAIMWVEDLERMQVYGNNLMARLNVLGNSEKIFRIRLREITVTHNEQVVKVRVPYVTNVRVKAGHEGASLALGDVLEWKPGVGNSPYILTEEQAQFIKTIYSIEDDVLAFVKREQAKLGGGEPWIQEMKLEDGMHYVHRSTTGGIRKGEIVYIGGKKIGRRQSIQHTRYYETMLEGADAGVQYGYSAESYVRTYIDSVARIVADHRFDYALRPYGKTIGELIDVYFPGLKNRYTELSNLKRYLGGGMVEYTKEGKTILRQYPGIKRVVQDALKSKKITEQTYKSLENYTARIRRFIPDFPDVARIVKDVVEKPRAVAELELANLVEANQKLQKLVGFTLKEYESSISLISNEMWNELRIAPNTLKQRIIELRGGAKITKANPITPSEMSEALKTLNVETKTANSMLEQIYKNKFEWIRDNIQGQVAQGKVTKQVLKDLKLYTKQEVREDAKQLIKDIDSASREIERLRLRTGAELKSAKEAVPRMSGMTRIYDQPAFNGRLFPPEIAEHINKTLNVQSNKFLKGAADVSALFRTMVAAMDVSAPFIHGLPILGYDPELWARATWRHLHSFVNPKVHAKYLLENEAVIQEASLKYGMYIGGSEYYEAMAHLQRIAGGAGKLFGGETGNRFALNVIRNTYGRAEAVFGSFGDIARVEMWKALKPRIESRGESLYELAQSLNKMTGVSSSRGLGIGTTQMQIESAFIFFAPRYTRAGFALLGDIFRGGLKGELARQSIGRLLIGGTALYVGTCYALGQKPDLNPMSGTFLTIQIGDHRVGIGGFTTSFVRFASHLTTKTADDPLWWTDWSTLTSRRDNPFLKFMYNKTTPLTSTIVDMANGTDYFGEPIEDVWDYARYLRDKVTPIAVQGMIQNWQDTGLTMSTIPAVFADVWGLRSWPRSIGERLSEMRDNYAPFVRNMTSDQRTIAKDRNLTWDDLTVEQKRQLLEDNPDLAALTKEYDLQRVTRGDEDTKLFAEWEEEQDKIKEWREGEWTIIIEEYKHNMSLRDRLYADDPTLTEEEIYKAQNAGKIFREKIKDIAGKTQEKRKTIEELPHFERVYEMLKEWKLDGSNQTHQDKAYDAWITMMYEEPGLEDPFGNPLYDMIEEREKEFIETWGWEAYDYVQRRLKESKQDFPLLLEYSKAKEVLEPYWNLKDELLASNKYPKNTEEQLEWVISAMRQDGDAGAKAADYYEKMLNMYSTDPIRYSEVRRLPYIKSVYAYAESFMQDFPTVDAVLAQKRIELRQNDPEIEKYYLMFYGYQPVEDKI